MTLLTEISLLDGIRVDIEAEVDALVPVPMMEDADLAEKQYVERFSQNHGGPCQENGELLQKIAETYRLGSTVKIQIED